MATTLSVFRVFLSICCGFAAASVAFADDHRNPAAWQELFNGKDLDAWTVKIAGQPVGQDKYQTFRVEDGLLKVRYDNYDGFADQFGHIFFQQPFSRYELLIEYRFVGTQVPDGPAWAQRNSGVMLHAQNPTTMTLDQDFPVSIEAQFLGGLSDNKRRPTGNVCTPGTDIVLGDSLANQHCSYSSSATFDGDQWVQMHIVVDGNRQFQHRINNEVVMTYRSPQLSADTANAKSNTQLALRQGFIALQSESHPIDFRRVALRALDQE